MTDRRMSIFPPAFVQAPKCMPEPITPVRLRQARVREPAAGCLLRFQTTHRSAVAAGKTVRVPDSENRAVADDLDRRPPAVASLRRNTATRAPGAALEHLDQRRRMSGKPQAFPHERSETVE